MKMVGGLQFILESFNNQFTPQNNIEIWIYISIVLKMKNNLARAEDSDTKYKYTQVFPLVLKSKDVSGS